MKQVIFVEGLQFERFQQKTQRKIRMNRNLKFVFWNFQHLHFGKLLKNRLQLLCCFVASDRLHNF